MGKFFDRLLHVVILIQNCFLLWDIFFRHESISWPKIIFLLISVTLLVLVWVFPRTDARKPREDTFRKPHWEIIDAYRYENQAVDVDGKSFRDCHFRNVTLAFHGKAPTEFKGNSLFESVILSTDHPPTMFWRTLEHLFSSIPGATLETALIGPDGQRVERKLTAHQIPNQPLSSDLNEFDPKIYVEFRDDRRAGVRGDKDNSRIVLVNRAQSRALLVCIAEIRLRDSTIKFPLVAQALGPQESANFSPVIERHNQDGSTLDIFLAIFWQWDSLKNRNIPDISIPLHSFYQDDARNLFETTCDLVFSVEEHAKVRTQGQNGGINVIEVKNQRWQRVAASSPLRRN